MGSAARPRPLVICSKSPWDPAVRREHAWATTAAEQEHPVLFVESPADVRRLRDGAARAWLGGLRAHGPVHRRVGPSLVVRRRSTLAPGHRGVLAGALDERLLRHALGAETTAPAALVCCTPWDWPAVAATPAHRRVFDMGDDWGELMPGRRARFEELYRRIAAEADEVIVVNPELAGRFPGRDALLVRNGVAPIMLAARAAPPADRTLVYTGTFTPRFDAPLVRRVLERLTDWRLELVGQCLYPGCGSGPAPELAELLAVGTRVRWHGPMPRERMIEVLDRGAVAIVPNRPERSLGQDSMKLYDYAARGRPIVSTRWQEDLAAAGPPHLHVAATTEEFVAAILAAAAEPAEFSADRRGWAAAHTWRERWPAWSRAVFAD